MRVECNEYEQLTPVEHEGHPICETSKTKLHEASRVMFEKSMCSRVKMLSTWLRISIYSLRNEVICSHKAT